ncbi:geranylgeranyl pyrophosphate synthase-like isoform X2 [Formica exsecta]|uniref:geranylgeranyl pyrophosphate synthase-like isoform X2 n=1 Tax=Formica exsecta TaxID=72781 RepID=UPI001143EA7A|nr:geranylgeranyl pyrophosphate synthase-like isoform X2 [Formica exsecta]
MTNTYENKPFYYSLSNDRQEDEKLLEPIRYYLQIPGKQITVKLAHAFNYWLKISPDRIQAINEIIIMLSNSCVIFDDIQVNSILRGGISTAHSVYGIARSLNAAHYTLIIALERIANLHPAATKVYMEQMLEAFRAQGMEIFWRENLICPKIGSFFNLMVKLMKLFSIYEEDLSSLGIILGLHFQIRNDYGNLNGNKYTENKSYCDDLSEGKFSFPIVHALTTNPDDRQIIYILKQRTKEIEVKHHCIELLEKFGSFKYTKSVLEELDMKARAEIERLGGNPLLIKLLDELKNLNYWD